MADDIVHTSGPLFDGRAFAELTAMAHAMEEAVAEKAVNEVKARLGEVLKNPTGFYESNIQTDRASGSDHFIVSDNMVIYGPWLEGVGSRNSSTRFKGYFTFRKVAQKMHDEAGPIAELVALPFVGRMN